MQNHTSADTSLNQVSALFKRQWARRIMTGKKVLDYGGGKYDAGIEYVSAYAEMSVYDPFNRDEDHNRQVMTADYDVVTVNNVLNVIDDDSAARSALIAARDKARGGAVLVSVYEGDRSGIGHETKKGWQRCLPAAAYLPMLESVFGRVIRHGKMFECYE